MVDIDPGRYFAERIRQLYPLSHPPTDEELLRICEDRGARVARVAGLQAPGLYVNWPIPAILLQLAAPTRVLAHELFHHIACENVNSGIVCCYPESDPEGDEEANAERFVRVLFGDED